MGLLKDLRIAVRVLPRAPAFTIVSVITMAIAIGAIAAIFTVVNGVLLRPLPYPDPEELITFSLDASRGGAGDVPLSPAGYWHFRNKNRSFEEFGGWAPQVVPLVSPGASPEQVDAAVTTWSVFPVLGVPPLRGRTFTAEEDVPGGPQLVVISHELWLTRFGADRDIVGKMIELNGTPREVIGVMPRGYAFPSADIDVWVPLRLDPATQNFGGHFIRPVARLRDGVSLAAAAGELNALIPRMSEVGYTPNWFTNVFTGSASITALRDSLIGESARPLLIVFGALAFVFLIACSNIANLFLVRARTRMRETAVRLAMGASKRQLIAYTLAESTVISLSAGGLGVLLAYLGTRTLLALQPASIPRLHEVRIDPIVLAFIAVMILLSSFLLGVLPAIRSGRVPVSAALREGGRSATTGRESHRLRGALVVSQVAMATLLLVGAGLMVRSAQAMRRVDPGFNAQGVLAFTLSLPPVAYPPGERSAAFFHELAESIRTMPAVTAVGAIDALPLGGQGAFLTAVIEGRPLGPNDFPPAFHVRRVTPGYFEALGIQVREGRAFEPADHQNRLGTAIISANVKANLWPDESPIGRRLGVGGNQAFSSIVGVVSDVRTTGLDEPFDEFVYLPMVDSAGGATNRMTFVVRSTADPLRLVNGIRDEVRRRDPDLPITQVQLLQETVDRSMADLSFTMLLLGIAAGIALVLGAVGIYGLISYVVGQRTAEIGIRISLGAAPSSVMRLFLSQAWLHAGAGIGIGLLAASLATRVFGGLIFGINPFDVMTFVFAPLLFLVIATVACLLPATRAAAVDPAIAMRQS
jgi:predicted permease